MTRPTISEDPLKQLENPGSQILSKTVAIP